MLNCMALWQSVEVYRGTLGRDPRSRQMHPSHRAFTQYSAVWIYIGESNDIQRRLLEHCNGANDCITRANPSGFMFEVCDLVERVRRQTALVAQFRPLCNQGVR